MHILIPGGEGRAARVEAGSVVAIENVAGGQVADVFAFNAADPSERLSAAHTRAHNWSLFPRVGQAFVSNRRRSILTLLADPLDGAHDMLVPACDPARYRQLGAPGHRSCGANLAASLRELSIEVGEVPQPVNLFMPVALGADGSISLQESTAKAGDRVVMRAEQPVVLVVSACPQDLVPLNAGGLSELLLESPPRG